MNFFRRGMLSITRKPIKSFILFVLIFILGSLMSGALSIHQGISNTERNLMVRLPPVSQLIIDTEAHNTHFIETGEQLQVDLVTPEMVHQIGSLPYVRDYDLTLEIGEMISRDLFRTLELDFDTSVLDEGVNQFLETDINSLRYYGLNIERFHLKGISNPEMSDIQAGLIELAEGRLFTQNEIDHGHHFAIISSNLAKVNHLSVGSKITLENNVYDHTMLTTINWPEEAFNDKFLFATEQYEFEVIGIFEPIGEVHYTHYTAVGDHRELQNQIYVPVQVVFDAYTFRRNGDIEIRGEEASPTHDVEEIFNTFFLLNDPRELNAFTESAAEILPEYWVTDDLTILLSEMTTFMDFMLYIADLILWGGTGAIFVITSLLVVLFFRDRRHEIGILIALGEQKRKIIGQLLFEVLSVSLVAIMLSSLSGHFFSREISRQMLEIQLLQSSDEYSELDFLSTFPGFNPGRMSIEEMTAAYEVTLDPITLVIFYSLALGVILLSLIIPIMYALKLKPKKILM